MKFTITIAVTSKYGGWLEKESSNLEEAIEHVSNDWKEVESFCIFDESNKLLFDSKKDKS